MNLIKQALEEKKGKNAINQGYVTVEDTADVLTDNPKVAYARHDDIRKKCEDSKELLYQAKLDLVEELKELNKISDESEAHIKKMTSKAKNYAEQMKDQLVKINNILGNDFENRIKQLERFVLCLEKLNELSSPKVREILDILKN